MKMNGIAAIGAALLICGACVQTENVLYRSDAEPARYGDTLLFTMPVNALAKGSQIDFMASYSAADSTTSPLWAVEFNNGKQWLRDNELVHVLPKAEGHNSIVFRTFTTASLLDSVTVRMVPVCQDCEAGANQTLLPARDRHIDQRIVAYQGYKPCSKEMNIGLIGNSFTYYYGAGFMLKEIARCQGVQLNIHASLKGGQYFRNHIGLDLTREMMAVGGYDFVFLQDQSQQSARHYEWLHSEDHAGGSWANVSMSDMVLPETKTLGDAVLAESPNARIILEATWAYEGSNNWQGYGSFQAFDKAMQEGGEDIARQLGYICSPIGRGFELARSQGINPYWTDNKHQNAIGSYIKACINYLLIMREYGLPVEFSEDVPDCGIPSDIATSIRAIALSLIS